MRPSNVVSFPVPLSDDKPFATGLVAPVPLPGAVQLPGVVPLSPLVSPAAQPTPSPITHLGEGIGSPSVPDYRVLPRATLQTPAAIHHARGHSLEVFTSSQKFPARFEKGSPIPLAASPIPSHTGDVGEAHSAIVSTAAAGSLHPSSYPLTNGLRPQNSPGLSSSSAPTIVSPPLNRPADAMEEPVTLAVQLIRLSKLLIGSMALSVIFLGWEPSKLCIDNASCGAWLQNWMGYYPSLITFFLFAGLNYALLSFAFAKESLDQWYRYVSEEKNLGLKIIKFFLVPGFAVSQAMQMYFIMQKVAAPTWQIGLAVAGDIASKLFTAVYLLQVDIPYFLSKIAMLRGATIRTIFYRLQHERFKRKLKVQYADMSRDPAIMNQNKLAGQDPFLFLLDYRSSDKDNPFLSGYEPGLKSQLFRGLIGGAGFVLGCVLAYTMASATYRAVDDDIGLTILFSLASSYLFPKTLLQQFLKLADGIIDLVNGKSIIWLAYRASPAVTILFNIIFGITAVLSYATINVLLQNSIENETSKQILLPLVCFAAAAFNLSGVNKLYDMMRATFVCCSRNQTERLLHKLENEILEQEEWRTESAFIDRVESSDPNTKKFFSQAGVNTYSWSAKVGAQWYSFFPCCRNNKINPAETYRSGSSNKSSASVFVIGKVENVNANVNVNVNVNPALRVYTLS